jgi:hypothetical protein
MQAEGVYCAEDFRHFNMQYSLSFELRHFKLPTGLHHGRPGYDLWFRPKRRISDQSEALQGALTVDYSSPQDFIHQFNPFLSAFFGRIQRTLDSRGCELLALPLWI